MIVEGTAVASAVCVWCVRGVVWSQADGHCTSRCLSFWPLVSSFVAKLEPASMAVILCVHRAELSHNSTLYSGFWEGSCHLFSFVEYEIKPISSNVTAGPPT